jgi:hypothetical protein
MRKSQQEKAYYGVGRSHKMTVRPNEVRSPLKANITDFCVT